MPKMRLKPACVRIAVGIRRRDAEAEFCLGTLEPAYETLICEWRSLASDSGFEKTFVFVDVGKRKTSSTNDPWHPLRACQLLDQIKVNMRGACPPCRPRRGGGTLRDSPPNWMPANWTKRRRL